jgi:hypothetical protein
MAETIRRLLFIVGSKRPDFYESLRRTFRGDDTVQIVLDRRRGERRAARRPARRGGPERRGDDRREHLEIQRQLRSRGYAVVGVPSSDAGALRPRSPGVGRALAHLYFSSRPLGRDSTGTGRS